MSPHWKSALCTLFVVLAATTSWGQESPSSAWVPPDSAAVEVLPTPADEASMDGATEAVGSPDPAGPWLLSDGEIDAEDSVWYRPTYWFGPSPWDTGIELGLNGSSGNNDSLSIRSGGYVKRSSRFSKFEFSGYHNLTKTDVETTQNNATSDIRNDWLLDDESPWMLYAKANIFFDEFQAFDLQTNANSGVGYQFFKDPAINLTGRCGGGASREFGGPDDQWTPEALFGFEYEQTVSKTQKFYAKFEYFPEFENVDSYRLVADGGWEIELDRPSNVSLKISANDRYDSTPNGVDPNLVNYSVLLLIKL